MALPILSQPHGIMLHHFYDEQFIRGQGAINQEDLVKIIEHYKPENILSASDWYKKAISNNLKDNDYCITFDDTLLCQYEIALPILEEYNITAFWFVYSSVLNGNIEPLEVFRKFRTEHFSTIDEFYEFFFAQVETTIFIDDSSQSIDTQLPDTYLSEFPFYSKNDKKFRFLRDRVLTTKQYNDIMTSMIDDKGLSMRSLSENLWMTRSHIKQLHEKGHIVGLHSTTHPTSISSFDKGSQAKEYQSNFDDLLRITEQRPRTMSHPCNSYNEDTLNILENLGIKLGFCSNMSQKPASLLEFPREDHANILARISTI